MKHIGITGGIGSGKSTVARIFESMGYAVYYSDKRAKALMTEDAKLVKGVKDLFGAEAYFEDGSLNRAFVGEQVFNDEKKLEALNALVHPAVGRDYRRWAASLKDYDKPFTLKEAAILFESGADRDTDEVIAVYAPKKLRIERVMARDGVTAEAVEARMAKQWPESKKMARSDYIIYNDGKHMLIPQVLDFISRISDFGFRKKAMLPKIRNPRSEIRNVNCRGNFLDLSSPKVMGILNVTPDSFSDGGRFNSLEKALPQAEKMLKEGAAILDIGAYSSRPGADDIPVEEEFRRLEPVVEGIINRFPEAIISIDTFHAPVAKAMLDRGVHLINDIGAGLLDPAMPETVAAFGAPYIIMHMQGNPQTMQKDPRYDNVVQEVWQFLVKRVNVARAAGVKDIIIDPGFGFGKTVDHNYALLRDVGIFSKMDLPVLVGLSRKSMLYKPFGARPDEVLDLAGAAHLHALQQGAHILRVHDVAAAVRIVGMFALLQGNGAV